MMDVYEGSIPLRFSPDGLDEAAIDALIEQTCIEVSPPSVRPPTDIADMRRRRSARLSPTADPFGDEAA